MDNKFQNFKSALAEATYCYNTSIHRSTSFAPLTLHTGQLLFSPGLLHLDNTLSLPPAWTGRTTRGSRPSWTTSGSSSVAWSSSTALRHSGGPNNTTPS